MLRWQGVGTIQADAPCLACAARGTPIGYDRRGRELFACLAEGCDVAEYDREVIRRREGTPIGPPFRAAPASDGGMNRSGHSTDPPRIPPGSDPTCGRLTPSEQAVALLVGEGLDNSVIAKRLGLNPSTVQNSIRRVLWRLKLNSRDELAAWVVARRTLDDAGAPLRRSVDPLI